MAIPLTCLCGRTFRIKDALAGQEIRCPDCNNVLTVPRPEVGRPSTWAESPSPKPQSRPEPVRDQPRRGPRVAFERGWFGSLKAGVVGGLLMMVIAVVWFAVGLRGGIIFFYPPILLVIGFIAMIRGLMRGR